MEIDADFSQVHSTYSTRSCDSSHIRTLVPSLVIPAVRAARPHHPHLPLLSRPLRRQSRQLLVCIERHHQVAVIIAPISPAKISHRRDGCRVSPLNGHPHQPRSKSLPLWRLPRRGSCGDPVAASLRLVPDVDVVLPLLVPSTREVDPSPSLAAHPTGSSFFPRPVRRLGVGHPRQQHCLFQHVAALEKRRAQCSVHCTGGSMELSCRVQSPGHPLATSQGSVSGVFSQTLLTMKLILSAQLAYAVALTLHMVEILFRPPASLPDLYTVLNILLSAGIFGLSWLWSIKRLVEISWAMGPLGSSIQNLDHPGTRVHLHDN
jgi:hypothetical protein